VRAVGVEVSVYAHMQLLDCGRCAVRDCVHSRSNLTNTAGYVFIFPVLCRGESGGGNSRFAIFPTIFSNTWTCASRRAASDTAFIHWKTGAAGIPYIWLPKTVCCGQIDQFPTHISRPLASFPGCYSELLSLSAGNLALLSDPSHKEVITEHRGRAYLEAMGWTCGSALAQVLPNKFIHTFPGTSPSLASLSFGWRGETAGEGAEPDLNAVEQTQPQRTSLRLENVIAAGSRSQQDYPQSIADPRAAKGMEVSYASLGKQGRADTTPKGGSSWKKEHMRRSGLESSEHELLKMVNAQVAFKGNGSR
jgi:hypothetical protein